MKDTIKGILKERTEIFKKIGISSDCKWFREKTLTTIADLVDVFYHPQGVMFCQEHNYPSLDILRRFKCLNVAEFGVYIDAGEVTLYNPKRVILIGNTQAIIECDKGGSDIIVMHSAKADITVKGWSVARVHYNNGCNVIQKRSDRAILNVTKSEVI